MITAVELLKSYFDRDYPAFQSAAVMKLESRAFISSTLVMTVLWMLLDFPFAFVGALAVRRRISLTAWIKAKCYSCALIPVGGVMQVAANSTYIVLRMTQHDITTSTIVAVEFIPLALFSVLLAIYNASAIASFNGIELGRFLLGYFSVSLAFGFAIGVVIGLS